MSKVGLASTMALLAMYAPQDDANTEELTPNHAFLSETHYRGWGTKKVTRFIDLRVEGFSFKQAMTIVTKYKGIIPKDMRL